VKRARNSLALLAGAGLAWGLIERRWFALRHQTIPALAPLPSTGVLRVLHLSDLHLQPGDRRMRQFIRRSLRRGPDLVVVTGDILGHPDAIDDAVDTLADAIAGRQGVAVLGSNDRFAPTIKNPLRYFMGPSGRPRSQRMDTDRLVVGLKEAGWHVLCNERTTLRTAIGDVDVVGLDDPHMGAASPEQVDWSPPPRPVPLRLGVVHAPYVDILDHFAGARFDVTLAGHTHGGQVRLPGIGALVDNCDLPLGMARGLSRFDGHMWLHVSAGLGTSRYAPVRFACRPEASVLDLVPRHSTPPTL
jgi:predicted MPP superfamily phosphohydrolase